MMDYVFRIILISLVLFLCCVASSDDLDGFCQVGDSAGECNRLMKGSKKSKSKYLFYDINPGEGFNLRRDVYLRMAIFMNNLHKQYKYVDIKLVLPPFSNLYHWQSTDVGNQERIPWNLFFNVESLQTFTPVVDLFEVFVKEKVVKLDRVYVLMPFKDPFENGVFEDKWEMDKTNSCIGPSHLWGYNNISFVNKECVRFQGATERLRELIDLHPADNMVMITNAQIPLHDEFGTKTYWDARRSMKFNTDLVSIAKEFIERELLCSREKCDNYISLHWRRGDFAKYRPKDVPSVNGTAKQIKNILQNIFESRINTVFIATDSSKKHFDMLVNLLFDMKINVKWFVPTVEVKMKYKDGGVAILDQIICSHAAYFAGTHESTFSFRIQEEREILGFDSRTTFNRLCPDTGPCQRPSVWKIVK